MVYVYNMKTGREKKVLVSCSCGSWSFFLGGGGGGGGGRGGELPPPHWIESYNGTNCYTPVVHTCRSSPTGGWVSTGCHLVRTRKRELRYDYNMVSRLETLLDHTSILSLGAPKSYRATGLLLHIRTITGQATLCTGSQSRNSGFRPACMGSLGIQQCLGGFYGIS